MSIDTAEKRRMAAGVPLGWGVTLNLFKDEEWRAQVAGSYIVVVTRAPDATVGISPTWGNSLYKPMHYAPLRYAPARWKPIRYRKPF